MLEMRQKKAITEDVGNRYINATKKDKSKILDEFSATTKYNRAYAARILRLSPGRTIGYSRISGKKSNMLLVERRK